MYVVRRKEGREKERNRIKMIDSTLVYGVRVQSRSADSELSGRLLGE